MKVSYGPQPHLVLGGEPVQSVSMHRTSMRWWVEVNGLVVGKGTSLDRNKVVSFRNLLSNLEYPVVDAESKPTGINLKVFPYQISYLKGVLSIDKTEVINRVDTDRSQSGIHLRNLLNKANRQPVTVKTDMWRKIADHLFDHYSLDNYNYYGHPMCSNCPGERSVRLMY